MSNWSHPGGKLRELGAEALSDAELLAILISTGVKGTSAEKIATEVIARFGSLCEMANVPLERFLDVKGFRMSRSPASLRRSRSLVACQGRPGGWRKPKQSGKSDVARKRRG